MTTLVFPIFRSLQRALAGGANIAAKHEPSLAVAVQRHLNTKDDKDDKEENAKGNAEERTSDACSNENGITHSNPNSWPINSDEARTMRREFVTEGFRRLYDVALTQNNIYLEGYRGAMREDGIGRQSNTVEVNPNSERSHDPVLLPPVNGENDWVCLAQ